MKKYGLFIAYTLVLVVVVGAASSGLTLLLCARQRVVDGDQITIDSEDYQALMRYQRLEAMRRYIQENFIEDVDEQGLIYGALQGMFYSLDDPYSYFLTPEQTAEMTELEEGQYFGVGLLLAVDPDDALITVTRVYKDSPAEAAGILPGDKIIGVMGTAYTGQQLSEAVSHIRGEPGTQAEIHLMRGEERLDVMVDRAEVQVNRVEARMLKDGVGLVTIYEFESDAVDAFEDALKYLEGEKAKGMIIDLRGNPGGRVDIVTEICDLLLPEVTIVTIKDKQGNTETISSDAAMITMPIVVLVNGMSASSSEIMAAALRDHGVARLVGTQTFGKGIVQSYFVFKDDNSSVNMTTAHYYTPSGENIHMVGITPDVVVEVPEEFAQTLIVSDEDDAQLQAAITQLREMIGE